MVSIAILRKFSREGMLKHVIHSPKSLARDDVRVVETSTHLRFAIFGNVALLLGDTQLATLAWGLGYDEVYGPDKVSALEIGISNEEFSIRLYEWAEREPWARVKYPVEALKRARELVLPFKRDTDEEWKRYYYRVYVLVRGREVGPMIMAGEKEAVLIWPEGIDIMEALSRVEEPQADNEAPRWLEEAVERWARELGVIE